MSQKYNSGTSLTKKKKLTKLSCCLHTSAKKLSTYSIPAFPGTFAITHGIADEAPQVKTRLSELTKTETLC
jgi:hypothetical protein